MSCSSSKSSVNIEETSKFGQNFDNNIISFFDKRVKTGMTIVDRSPMDEVFLNETRSASHRDSYSVRSLKNNISNLRGVDNFVLLKKDSIFMKLDISSSERFSFKGKIKKIRSTFNQKNKAQIIEYKIDDKNIKNNLFVKYFENKNVNISFNSLVYKGTWREYKRPSLNKKPLNRSAK